MITTLSTGPQDGDSSVFPFGLPNNVAFGEVFTAPVTGTLTSFSMPTIYSPFNGYPNSGGGVGNLRGTVGTWNGPSTIGLGYGSPKTLYKSGFTPSPGAAEYTFSPDVHVIARHQYVAFLTVYGDPLATGSASMPTNSNTVSGIDYFVFNQTSRPFRNASWDYGLLPGLNVADFSATFTTRGGSFADLLGGYDSQFPMPIAETDHGFAGLDSFLPPVAGAETYTGGIADRSDGNLGTRDALGVGVRWDGAIGHGPGGSG